ncbi:sensor histidine kinase [Sphingomonas sp.]|uniref:sensor histidine kinase n=1 Tax=Sphingomonas sp. TaxID=28214 RepID=UPI000DB44253|nr:histidine kinase [Sphingomonas sp.]PZU09785.1 MAG: histidine kinase [Sphingomonas sp.]
MNVFGAVIGSRFPEESSPMSLLAERRRDIRWRDGAVITIALWSFTLLIYLPMIIGRYAGMGVTSVLLDCSTILVSMLFGISLFALFRATLPLSGQTRLIVMIVAVLVIAIVQAAFDLLFMAVVAHNLEMRWLSLPQDLRHSYGAALNYACVFAVNSALFQLAAGRRKAERQERQLAEFRAEAQQAEVDSLRLKLNPHFLFNTLNAISTMVVTRRNAEAEQGLELLSSFLRASISTDPATARPLEEQFQLIDHYLSLEEMRFGERLVVAIDYADDVADLAVPPLLIQPLIEEAIRDGVERSLSPVRISVSAHRRDGDLELRVSDDAPRVILNNASRATANVRTRLAGLYGLAASVISSAEGGVFATTLRLPAVPA